MSTIIVPRYVLLNGAFPGGRRTPKKVLLPTSPVKIYTTKSSSGFTADPDGLAEMEFANHEFQFWCVRFKTAYCRRCLAMFGTKSARRAHHTSFGCTKTLVAAYRKLLFDSKCIVCDGVTVKCLWGVPICGENCRIKWCTQETQPDALKAAIRLVESQGKVN